MSTLNDNDVYRKSCHAVCKVSLYQVEQTIMDDFISSLIVSSLADVNKMWSVMLFSYISNKITSKINFDKVSS